MDVNKIIQTFLSLNTALQIFIGVSILAIAWGAKQLFPKLYRKLFPPETEQPAITRLPEETDQRKLDATDPTIKLLTAYCRAIPFHGRDEEETALEGFLDSPNSAKHFSWWAICGTGGSGKTRLALEFCLTLNQEKDWTALWLDLKNTPATLWEKWQPLEPTLLVVDYAAQHHQLAQAGTETAQNHNISNIIDSLLQRQETLRYPVRLLMLERQYEQHNPQPDTEANLEWQEWYVALAKGQDTKGCLRQDACHNEKPLELAPVPDTAFVGALQKIYPAIKQQKQAFLQELETIDAKKRMLIAILLALHKQRAESNGASCAPVTRETLFQEAIDREYGRYWNGDHARQLKSAPLDWLLLATMCGGLHSGQGNWNPNDDEMAFWQTTGYGLNATGTEEGTGFCLHPMEPDLLGEYLVLSEGPAYPQHKGASRLDLLQQAWAINPRQTTLFLNRCCQDYVQLETLLPMLLHKPKKSTTHFLWGVVIANAIASYGVQQHLEAAKILYESMTTLGEAQAVREIRARAAFTLITFIAQAGKNAEAKTLYESMTALGEEQAVRLQRARAAVNLISAYGNAGQIAEAKALHEDMTTLGTEEAVRARRAAATFNLLSTLLRGKQIGEAKVLYETMATLGEEEAVCIERAKAAVNLIAAYGKAGHIAEARAIYNGMEALGTGEAVRALQATSAFNLVNALLQDEKIAEAKVLYKEMATLGEEETVCVERAKGALNLIIVLVKDEQITQAKTIYKSMTALGAEEAVRELRAKAAFLLLTVYHIAGEEEEIAYIETTINALGDTEAVKALVEKIEEQ